MTSHVALTLLDRVFPPNPRAFMTSDRQTGHEIGKAAGSMGMYLAELDAARLAEMTILDFGCGWGGETLWLSGRVGRVCGADVNAEAIAQARKSLAASALDNCRFEHSSDGRLPFADESFDAVLSTDTFEHVMDLDLAYREIGRVLKPGGSLITRFGPLFYSPLGYHLYWACQVPYAHLLFGLQGVTSLRTRRDRNGATRPPAATWQDLGLNQKRFDDYRAAVVRAGLQIVRFDPVPVRGMRWLTRVPAVKDLFIFGVDCHVRRPS